MADMLWFGGLLVGFALLAIGAAGVIDGLLHDFLARFEDRD